MVKRKYTPERGDIVWVSFNPKKGHEQAGKRPALVLSSKLYNEKSGLILACPITSQIKGYPFEVLTKDGKINGVILSDQVRSLDWKIRKVKFIQKTKGEIFQQVQEHIIALLTE